MLTKVTAYSQWANVPPLVLNVINRPDTDLFEVRNIDGLGAVKADVNTTPLGSIPGESFVGSAVGKRNIVFTLGLDPDWQVWTVSKLRRLLDKTFMPQQEIRLVFETLEFSPVEISGWIESNEPNIFSKDPEHQISVICPQLYFKAVDPVIINGRSDQIPWPINYEGNVETGLHVEVTKLSGADPHTVTAKVMDPAAASIAAHGLGSAVVISGTDRVVIDTTPGQKIVQKVTAAGAITNLLNPAVITGRWPVIGPGTDTFEIDSDGGVLSWALTYYDLFGSL